MIALVVAIVLVTGSAFTMSVVGAAEGSAIHFGANGAAHQTLVEPLRAAGFVIGVTSLVVVGAHILLGSWATAQGIVAVVKRAGRKYGVAAICVSNGAVVTSFVAFQVAFQMALPS